MAAQGSILRVNNEILITVQFKGASCSKWAISTLTKLPWWLCFKRRWDDIGRLGKVLPICPKIAFPPLRVETLPNCVI